jgi:hypothetical protein
MQVSVIGIVVEFYFPQDAICGIKVKTNFRYNEKNNFSSCTFRSSNFL